jgi:hypothetical protein
MKNSVVHVCLAALLLAGLAIPALADGSPVPWPKKANVPVLRMIDRNGPSLQELPLMIVDGLPVPWPKKLFAIPKAVADGSPVPWPKKIIVTPKTIADGSPVPWPKKSASESPQLIADGSPVPWPKK